MLAVLSATARLDRLGALCGAMFGRTGADATIGRRVPPMFRAAGLTDVDAHGVGRQLPGGAHEAHGDP